MYVVSVVTSPSNSVLSFFLKDGSFVSLWRKFMPNQISHSYIRLKSISQENLPTFYHCATFTRTRWNFLPRERTSKWKGLKQLYTYVGCYASMKIWWPGFISTCHHYIHMKYSSFRSKLNEIVGRAKVGEEWKLNLANLEIIKILGFANFKKQKVKFCWISGYSSSMTFLKGKNFIFGQDSSVGLNDANMRQHAPTDANRRQQAKMRQQKWTKMRQQKD